jgi:AcrR family transcriptional regulator
VATTTAERLSARERLLAAADELFYNEGIQTVGIDRVIERAGVAKASLYSTFGSKEALICAYLERRHAERVARVEVGLARYDTPREKLLGIFDVMGETMRTTSYRGCAFINASAEAPHGGAIEEMSDATRKWLKDLLTDLARRAGARHPAELGRQLAIVYDGAVVTTRMDRNPKAHLTAKAIAVTLIDAALAG